MTHNSWKENFICNLQHDNNIGAGGETLIVNRIIIFAAQKDFSNHKKGTYGNLFHKNITDDFTLLPLSVP